MKSIVRRDDGQSYDEHVAELMKAEGMEEPTPEQRQRFDRKRKKSLSNRDWVNPHDPEARITNMKDGRTHLAYKAEQVVDPDTGAVVALGIQPGDQGDTDSLRETLSAAGTEITTDVAVQLRYMGFDQRDNTDSVVIVQAEFVVEPSPTPPLPTEALPLPGASPE